VVSTSTELFLLEFTVAALVMVAVVIESGGAANDVHEEMDEAGDAEREKVISYCWMQRVIVRDGIFQYIRFRTLFISLCLKEHASLVRQNPGSNLAADTSTQ
jgi:hypothetical protein